MIILESRIDQNIVKHIVSDSSRDDNNNKLLPIQRVWEGWIFVDYGYNHYKFFEL